MSDIGAWIAIIALIITAAGVAGGSFRMTRHTQIVSNFRDAAQAWEAKSETQQAEINDLRRQLEDRDHQITELAGRVHALQDIVVGAGALDAIRAEISEARNQIIAAVNERRAS